MAQTKPCPKCGASVSLYRNPVPTVDIIIPVEQIKVVLIRRRNPPHGWALPGGFVDYGESVEQAAKREAQEETGLQVTLEALVGVYSHPERDPRQHTLSVVFLAQANDLSRLAAGDDAGRIDVFPLQELPELAFDHRRILEACFALAGESSGLPGHGVSVCRSARLGRRA